MESTQEKLDRLQKEVDYLQSMVPKGVYSITYNMRRDVIDTLNQEIAKLEDN